MKWTIDTIVRLIRTLQKVAPQKWSFLGLFGIAFLASVLTLAKLDLLPNLPNATATAELSIVAAEQITPVAPTPAVVEMPTKITIEKINLSVEVSNPTATDIPTLDKALLSGAVRYPTSAKLGERGNVVIFGHSSYLPVVNNQAYKAFNGIQKLALGDTVTVYSATTAYTYRVRTVAKESTNSATIPLDVSGKVLTLSTCDSFGATTDRFVVTADLVESHPAGSSEPAG